MYKFFPTGATTKCSYTPRRYHAHRKLARRCQKFLQPEAMQEYFWGGKMLYPIFGTTKRQVVWRKMSCCPKTDEQGKATLKTRTTFYVSRQGATPLRERSQWVWLSINLPPPRRSSHIRKLLCAIVGLSVTAIITKLHVIRQRTSTLLKRS